MVFEQPASQTIALPLIPHSQPWVTEADTQAIIQVVQSGMLSHGKICDYFESQFAQFHSLPEESAVSVPSGASGIALALLAKGIKPEEEVILPSYVCDSVEKAVKSIGAKPVLCDIGQDWLMNAETISAVITPYTKAIIVVHLFGLPVAIKEIQHFGIPIIEDCCQALGTQDPASGMPVGLQGDFGVFSFHATKCLTTGEGGMVISHLPENAWAMKQLQKENPLFRPLNDIQAALGLNQLSQYPQALARRKDIAQYYLDALPHPWTSPLKAYWESSNFFRFPLWMDNATSETFSHFQKAALQRQVSIRRGVDALLKSQDRAFPNANRAFQNTVSIPIHPVFTETEMRRVVDSILTEQDERKHLQS